MISETSNIEKTYCKTKSNPAVKSQQKKLKPVHHKCHGLELYNRRQNFLEDSTFTILNIFLLNKQYASPSHNIFRHSVKFHFYIFIYVFTIFYFILR